MRPLLFNPPQRLWNEGFSSPLTRRPEFPERTRPRLFEFDPASRPSIGSQAAPTIFPRGPSQYYDTDEGAGIAEQEAYAGAQDPDAPTTDNPYDFARGLAFAGSLATMGPMGAVLTGAQLANMVNTNPKSPTNFAISALESALAPSYAPENFTDPGYGYGMSPSGALEVGLDPSVDVGFTDPGYGYGDTGDTDAGGFGPGDADEVEEAGAGETAATGGDDSDDDAGGEDSVVCTVLFEAGRLPAAIYAAEAAAGRALGPEVMRGYHLWGRPLASLMRRHTWLQGPIHAIIRPFLVQLIRKRHGWMLRTGIELCRAMGRRLPPDRTRQRADAADPVGRRAAAPGASGGEVVPLPTRLRAPGGASRGHEAVVGHLRACAGYADSRGRCSVCDYELARLRRGADVPDRDVLGPRLAAVGGHGSGRDRGLGPTGGSGANDPAREAGLEVRLRAAGL